VPEMELHLNLTGKSASIVDGLFAILQTSPNSPPISGNAYEGVNYQAPGTAETLPLHCE